MSIGEAKVRAEQLNANLKLKREELRIKDLQDKQNKFQLQNASVLPEEFVAEFEARFIRARGMLSEKQLQARNRYRLNAWRAAKK